MKGVHGGGRTTDVRVVTILKGMGHSVPEEGGACDGQGGGIMI